MTRIHATSTSFPKGQEDRESAMTHPASRNEDSNSQVSYDGPAEGGAEGPPKKVLVAVQPVLLLSESDCRRTMAHVVLGGWLASIIISFRRHSPRAYSLAFYLLTLSVSTFIMVAPVIQPPDWVCVSFLFCSILIFCIFLSFLNAKLCRLIFQEFYAWFLVFQIVTFCGGLSGVLCFTTLAYCIAISLFLLMLAGVCYDAIRPSRRRATQYLKISLVVIVSVISILLFGRQMPDLCEYRVDLKGNFTPAKDQCFGDRESGLPSLSLLEFTLNQAFTYVLVMVRTIWVSSKSLHHCVILQSPMMIMSAAARLREQKRKKENARKPGGKKSLAVIARTGDKQTSGGSKDGKEGEKAGGGIQLTLNKKGKKVAPSLPSALLRSPSSYLTRAVLPTITTAWTSSSASNQLAVPLTAFHSGREADRTEVVHAAIAGLNKTPLGQVEENKRSPNNAFQAKTSKAGGVEEDKGQNRSSPSYLSSPSSSQSWDQVAYPMLRLSPEYPEIFLSAHESSQKTICALLGDSLSSLYYPLRVRYYRVFSSLSFFNLTLIGVYLVLYTYFHSDQIKPLVAPLIALSVLLLGENMLFASNYALVKRVLFSFDSFLVITKCFFFLFSVAGTYCFNPHDTVVFLSYNVGTIANLIIDTYPNRLQRILRVYLLLPLFEISLLILSLYFKSAFKVEGMDCSERRVSIMYGTLLEDGEACAIRNRILFSPEGKKGSLVEMLGTTSFSWSEFGISNGISYVCLSMLQIYLGLRYPRYLARIKCRLLLHEVAQEEKVSKKGQQEVEELEERKPVAQVEAVKD